MATVIPSAQQISAYHQIKWKNFACEVCHSKQWVKVSPDGWPASAVMALNTAMKTSGAFWPVAIFVCHNCSNTKFVFLQSVLTWLGSEEGQPFREPGSDDLFQSSEMNDG